MKQYKDLLENIRENGVEKESGRENMPNTIGISHATVTCDLSEGFPLLTTKKMFLKGIIHELLWFIRGDTNIKYLMDNKVNIWNQEGYKWYLQCREGYHPDSDEEYLKSALSYDEFIEIIKTGNTYADDKGYSYVYHPSFRLGDLGKVYGHQWRNQNGIDQIADVLKSLQENPYSRYHIIDAWNKADFKDMVLPPCHLMYQFIVRPLQKGEDGYGDVKFHLDLNMYQRSCDTFLGVPFNIASASLLLMIMAKACNMKAGIFNWIGGDTHLYVTHEDAVATQLSREPRELPQLKINKDLSTLEDIESLTIDDFELIGYDPHPPIKAKLSVGLKK